MVCSSPAVPPSKAMRMSPAHRHSREVGPSSRAAAAASRGEFADTVLLLPEVFGQQPFTATDAPPLQVVAASPGTREKLVANDVLRDHRCDGPRQRAGEFEVAHA